MFFRVVRDPQKLDGVIAHPREGVTVDLEKAGEAREGPRRLLLLALHPVLRLLDGKTCHTRRMNVTVTKHREEEGPHPARTTEELTEHRKSGHQHHAGPIEEKGQKNLGITEHSFENM